jgi:hypothetical protein
LSRAACFSAVLLLVVIKSSRGAVRRVRVSASGFPI